MIPELSTSGGLPVLLAMMLLMTLSITEALLIPPPVSAAFKVNVLLVSALIVPLVKSPIKLLMAPPNPRVATFEENVQLLMIPISATLEIAPPKPGDPLWLFENVLAVIADTLPLLEIAPPSAVPPATLNENVV